MAFLRVHKLPRNGLVITDFLQSADPTGDRFPNTGREIVVLKVPNSTTLLSDTFTGTDGTSLDAHTMGTGSGWTEGLGDWDIQSNRANSTGADPGAPGWVATANAGQDSYDLTAVANLTGLSADAGVIFRYLDVSNFWVFVAEPPDVVLYERVGGSFVQRERSTPGGIATGVDATLRVVANGSQFACHANGALQFTHNAAAPGTGRTRCGLFSTAASDRFDNFSAVTIASAQQVRFDILADVDESVGPYREVTAALDKLTLAGPWPPAAYSDANRDVNISYPGGGAGVQLAVFRVPRP